MTKTFLDTVWRWTNESMGRKGRRRCTKNEFFAYIGLEMGMSLMKFNDIQSIGLADVFWAMIPFVQLCPETVSNKFAAAFVFCRLAYMMQMKRMKIRCCLVELSWITL